jgi:hypothetical protein
MRSAQKKTKLQISIMETSNVQINNNNDTKENNKREKKKKDFFYFQMRLKTHDS